MNKSVMLTEEGVKHFLKHQLFNPQNLHLKTLVGRRYGVGSYEFPVGWVDKNDGVHFFWTLYANEVEISE